MNVCHTFIHLNSQSFSARWFSASPQSYPGPFENPISMKRNIQERSVIRCEDILKAFSWYEFFDSKDVIMPICCVIVALSLV